MTDTYRHDYYDSSIPPSVFAPVVPAPAPLKAKATKASASTPEEPGDGGTPISTPADEPPSPEVPPDEPPAED